MLSNTITFSHNPTQSQELFNNILNKYSKTKISILDTLLDMIFRYKKVYPSQEWLAKKAGCKRETVNRLLADLEESGIIVIVSRGKQKEIRYKDKTCLYMAASGITKSLCISASKFLKSFRFFNVKYLCSRTIQTFQNKNVTQVNYINYNYLYNNPCIPVPCISKETISKQKGESLSGRIKNKTLKGEKVAYANKYGGIGSQYRQNLQKTKSQQNKISWIQTEEDREKKRIPTDPIAEIRKWVEWIESDSGKTFMQLCGHPVSPGLRWAIELGGLSEETIREFFKQYPYIQKYFDNSKSREDTK